MMKKITVLLVVLVSLVFVEASFGAWVFWNNGGAGTEYTNAANWDVLPTAGDDAVVGMDVANGATLSSGTGYANWLHLSSNAAGGSQLTVNGGTLQVSDHLLVSENWGAAERGTLIVDSGTVNTTLLMVGGSTNGANGNGTLTMNGGVVNVSWLFAIAGGYSGTTGGGVGAVALNGGTINATGGGSLVMSANGSLDITGGNLVLGGNIADVTTYGNVTAYGGAGSFVYNFDGANTTISAIPEPATLALIGLGSLLLRRKRTC